MGGWDGDVGPRAGVSWRGGARARRLGWLGVSARGAVLVGVDVVGALVVVAVAQTAVMSTTMTATARLVMAGG